MEEKQHPLKGYWLTRTSLVGEGIDPWKSIMDMQDIDAAEVLIATTGKKFSGDYIEERRNVEKWLFDRAIKSGVITDGNPPLYLTFSSEPAKNPKEGRICINIPAERIPTEYLSFTVYDSFHNYSTLQGRPANNAPKELQPVVYTAVELSKLVLSSGFPRLEDGGYIECQIWRRNLSAFREAEVVAHKKGDVVTNNGKANPLLPEGVTPTPGAMAAMIRSGNKEKTQRTPGNF